MKTIHTWLTEYAMTFPEKGKEIEAEDIFDRNPVVLDPASPLMFGKPFLEIVKDCSAWVCILDAKGKGRVSAFQTSPVVERKDRVVIQDTITARISVPTVELHSIPVFYALSLAQINSNLPEHKKWEVPELFALGFQDGQFFSISRFPGIVDEWVPSGDYAVEGSAAAKKFGESFSDFCMAVSQQGVVATVELGDIYLHRGGSRILICASQRMEHKIASVALPNLKA